MKLTAFHVRIFEVGAKVVFASFSVIGLIALALGGSGIQNAGVALLPSGLFAGLLLLGLALLFIGALALAATFITKSPLYIIYLTLSLCALATLGLYLEGFIGQAAAEQKRMSTGALFEEHWQSNKLEVRADIERSFVCCGLESPADFYGTPNWNRSCPLSALARNVCCQGMNWAGNVSALSGECGATQPRYACCTKTAWPCYRLPACFGVVTEWFITHTLRCTRCAIGSAIYLTLVLPVLFVGVHLIDAAKQRKSNFGPLTEEEEDIEL